MQTREIPPELRDIIHRRIYSAPDRVQKDAFGATPVKVTYWRDQNLRILTLGSAAFQRQAQEFNLRFENPLPGIIGLPGTVPPGVDAGFIFQGRKTLFSGSTTLNANRLVAIFQPGATALLSNWKLNLAMHSAGPLSYKFDTVFIAHLSNEIADSEMADDLEFLLVRYLSDYVVRVPDAT